MDAGIVRFGDCEIDAPRREVRLAAKTQSVAPRVFDLLLFLIDRRERVVTKDELLTHVWNGAVVSESVIARTVMKARQAIGDGAERPALIKTVHRVGYRFVGAIVSTQQPLATPAARVRIGLLPIDNATDDADLEWIESGLHAMVAHALENDPRISVVATAMVSQAVELLPPSLAAQEREEALARLLGADCLVSATARGTGSELQLDYRLSGSFVASASVRGAEPVVLGQKLAEAVEAAFFPQTPLPVRFESADPLANQAFARAIAVSNQEQWDAAVRLLKVVLDIEPGSIVAQLYHVRTLAILRDPTALPLGANLLASAAAAGNPRLLAAAHEAVAKAELIIEGARSTQRSRQHIDEALRLAEPFAGEDWVARIYAGQGLAAQFERRHAVATRFYELAERSNAPSGNQLRSASILNNRAELELCAGNPLGARQFAERCLEISRRHRLQALTLSSSLVLSRAEAALGLFDAADRRIREAAATLDTMPAHEFECVAWVLLAAGELEFEVRRAGIVEAAFAHAAHLGTEAPLRVSAALAMANGYRAGCRGDFDTAIAQIGQAIAAAESSGYREAQHDFVAGLIVTVLRSHRLGDLEAVLERARALPGHADDDGLQGVDLYAQAALLHGAGSAQAAIDVLVHATLRSPPGRVNARARLDAAWLQLERGDADAARAMVRHVVPWLREHPIGVAVDARMHHARGQWADAVRLQQLAVEAIRVPPPFLVELQQHYLAAATAQAGVALPTAPQLISLL